MSYEPNRLTAIYLSDAYEKLLPIKKHQIKSEEDKKDKKTEKINQIYTRKMK